MLLNIFSIKYFINWNEKKKRVIFFALREGCSRLGIKLQDCLLIIENNKICWKRDFLTYNLRLTNIDATAVLFPERLENAIPIRSIVQYRYEYCPLVCRCSCHSHKRVTVSTENKKDVRIIIYHWSI